MASANEQPRQPERIDPLLLSLNLGGTLLFFVLCLFLPAGTWMWTRAGCSSS